jgi:hypothetical protein|tara:strand:+ start:465 stop:572 length:108 start_codon:yes stop_codon:yes gene_type:complete
MDNAFLPGAAGGVVHLDTKGILGGKSAVYGCFIVI